MYTIMSTAGMFQILTNDGKQDKLLMASDFLRQRLMAIRQTRIRMGMRDVNPTLMDIEKTHLLFMNAHFKPFCAMGFEYHRVNTNTGSPEFTREINFSIPQYGDFFHDMFFYVKLKQPVLRVDAGTKPSDAPLMRWCDYPGERFFNTVKFDVNGNPLDEYTRNSYVFYRQLRVLHNKEAAYSRCMGQEEPQLGFVQQPTWVGNGVDAADVKHRFQSVSFSGLQTPTGQKDLKENVELLIPLLFWFNLDARLSVPSVTIPFGQRYIKATICANNELVELVPRGSGTWDNPNGSLDYTGVIVDIILYINNIFVNKEIHDIFIERIGFTLIRVHRYQTFTITKDADNLLLNQLKWPTETILVGFRPKEYNDTGSNTARRFNLNKWHSFCKIDTEERAAVGWQSNQLKLVPDAQAEALPEGTFNTNATSASDPITYTITAAATTAGTLSSYSKGDVIEFEFTDAFSKKLTVQSVSPVIANNGSGKLVFKEPVSSITGSGQLSKAAAWSTGSPSRFSAASYGTDDADFWRVWRSTPSEQTHLVEVKSPLVSRIKMVSHGIVLVDWFPQKILNSYVPYHYGGAHIRAPTDPGIYMINFCLYPGSYQPSGHINTSRAREFYLEFDGAKTFSASYSGELVIEASCLNFLLISDGSAVLRYTT